ncbi:hypothetical protein ENUP19_0173G0016 [Entamoeba nuttalli]|uniref:Uncharacterized protein n=1 Tax=Entamoeba nuttalli TaxID=412467 RepID=A0ABQ0DMM3_9EUKA
MFEVNNLTQQLLFLKDKSSKFENKNTHRKKRRRDDVTYNITDSSESQIVNELSPNVVVVDEISSSEDVLQIKRNLTQNFIEEIDIQHKNISTFELDNQKTGEANRQKRRNFNTL